MAETKRVSIAKHLTISLVVATVFLSVSFLTVYIIKINQQESTRLEKRADETIISIASNLEVPLWDLDRENLQIICSYYFRSELIKFLKLTGNSGEVFFSQVDESDKSPSHVNRSKEIFHRGEYIGKVEASFSPLVIKEARSQLLKTSIYGLLISILALILFTGFLFKKLLREPLRYLQNIAEAYAKRNYHPDLGPVSYVEFEPLVSAFVGMGTTVNAQMQALQKAEESLRAHRDNLEQMVRERTQQLEESNRELQKEIQGRQVAEDTLRENQQRLNAILKASPVGIGLVIQRKLSWANEAMYHLVGYKKDELLGCSARNLYSDDEEFERIGRLFYEGIQQAKVSSIETKWVKRDGTIIDCLLSACALNSSKPEDGQIVVAIDISKAKALEAKLKQAEKMEVIGTLAGGVAHDLNNILSGILSYPEMLLLDIPKDSPLRKPLETIMRSGEKAVGIVQDLLTLARRGVTTTEVINLNILLEEQLQSPEMEKLKQLYPAVNITMDLADSLMNVKGSSIHIAKSLMNLLSNAVEAMADGGDLFIRTEDIYLDTPVQGYENISEGDYVKLTLADTGSGIQKEELDKIFDPFYTSKMMGRSGTGLGLAVVWGTIKDHSGYINVESSPGLGTTFEIYLPITRDEISQTSCELPLSEIMGKGERILVVDDVAEQREIATGILKRLGYTVATLDSGEEAVLYMRSHYPDLVILDMIMPPGIDGLETYRQICRLRPAQKAIVTSGYSQTKRVKELQQLGVSAYIKKPYTIGKIGPVLRRELGKNNGNTNVPVAPEE